jgi:hypothetical protein
VNLAEKKFWKEAYLVALRSVVDARDWQHRGKPIDTPKERAELARDFADMSLKQARDRGAV